MNTIAMKLFPGHYLEYLDQEKSEKTYRKLVPPGIKPGASSSTARIANRWVTLPMSNHQMNF